MPYASTKELPESVKSKLDGKKLKQFKEVVNAQIEAGKSESVAFASAWAAVGKMEGAPVADAGLYEKFCKFIGLQKASGAETLYVRRSVANAEEIVAWAKENGFGETLQPDDMHVTIAFSKKPFHWRTQCMPYCGNLVIKGGNRKVEKLGDKGAVVLKIESVELTEEWASLRRMGASWDYESYAPHITITYNGGPTEIEPFDGDIILGPQIYEAIKEDWEETITEKNDWSIDATIEKLDEHQRLVYAWASIIEEDGKVLVDKQGDMIDEADLVNAAHEFVSKSRESHAMHKGEKMGEVVESMVFTKDVQKAMGIDLGKVGWFVVMKIHDDKAWKSYVDGTFKMLSIGGNGKREEVTDD